MALNDVIQEDDFAQLHGHVILSPDKRENDSCTRKACKLEHEKVVYMYTHYSK